MQSRNSRRPNRFQSIFTPYGLTLDLENHFGKFEPEQFYNVVDAIATGSNQDAQIDVFNLFKKLDKTEVIRRSKIIARLCEVLINTQIRRC